MATVAPSRPRSNRSRKAVKAKNACPYCGQSHGPWYYAAKDRWMLTVPDSTKANGQRQELLVKGWEGHDEALDEWHKRKSGLLPKVDPHENMLVGDLFHRHLEELHARVGLSPPNGISAGHYRDAARVLNDLATDPTYGIGGWTVKQLRTGGVERVGLLLGNRPNWGPATKRGYVSMIITAFRNQAKFIGSNPMEGLERPAAKPRDHFYTAEQVAAIIENANSEEFALFFNFLLHSGCRPSELCTLTAGDVQRKDGKLRLFLHHKNEKKTGGKRYVYLKHTWMQETIADLMQRRPKGPLFLNHIHCPWQENSLNAALRKTIRESEKCQALGLDDHDARFQIKRGKKEDFRVHHYVIYSARHTFAFRWLTGFFKDQKGNPIVLSLHEVAELMGNSAMMVEKVYGHIAKSGKLGEIVPV